MLREWKRGRNENESKTCSSFYADDGLIENTDPNHLQIDTNTIIELFNCVNLKANEKKTKFMIIRGVAAPKAQKKEMFGPMDPSG